MAGRSDRPTAQRWERRMLPTVGRPATRRLARLVAVEGAGALAILVIVAALNVTPPARHESPVWPRLEIAGYMPPMTTGCRARSPKIQEAVASGDAVRFTLRGILPNVAINAMQKID